MTIVRLTPEQEHIAQAAMATGRYAGPEEVVGAALRLLQAQDAQRAAFRLSLDEARRESDATGYFQMDEIAAELDAIIDAEEAKQRAGASR
ncbi:MAG: type II toxin-antitoxin system ParD family antitoxin [Roseococcus sp.]|nr:type II toxin-antitoxin system ParD family antitoxin [Roseococcus sp.]